MKQINWTDVEEYKESQPLPAGGYVCKIIKVVDNPDKEYLDIGFDIDDGELKDFFKKKFDADTSGDKRWKGRFIASYRTQGAMRFFKSMLTSIEKSNPNFKVKEFEASPNEKMLTDKRIGLLIAEKVFWNNDGKECKTFKVQGYRDIFKIKEGDFKIPEPVIDDTNKPKEPASNFDSDFHLLTEDDDVPF